MLAFQRRFDAALQYGRELMQSGAIGRVIKIYSSLEDSGPAPNGYQSDGILPDMSVHNVDEILWLTGRMPERALAISSRIYSHALTTCQEDFDDAVLFLWFGDDLAAQVQVTRNHVSGYRVETIIFGEQGQIQIGHFDQRPQEIVVEAYGRRGRSEPIARRAFPGGKGGPEFIGLYWLLSPCCLHGPQSGWNRYADSRHFEHVICSDRWGIGIAAPGHAARPGPQHRFRYRPLAIGTDTRASQEVKPPWRRLAISQRWPITTVP